ncbi:ribonuclease III [Candidatus Pelagibacter sp.]|nr:ribonuclease III [Candidatus Pelagibacter sp.]
MTKKLLSLEKKIKINFKDKNLLQKSLTHKSFSSDYNNEKLEFLGDRVLGLVISKNLLEIFPDVNEGVLDKKLASLVNRKKCYEISKKFDLENFISINNPSKKNYKIENKIISDACESLIGAIFIDQGLNEVEKFIIKYWGKDLAENIINPVDPKTRLQEYSLKKFKTLPKYKLISATGPRHKPIFKIAVRLENSKFINAKGNSKKEAEQNAANFFLKKVGL